MYATKFHVMTYRAIGFTFGRENDEFVVLGTVSIEQSACHTPILTLTDDANGAVTTYYALLTWREIYTQCISSRPL